MPRSPHGSGRIVDCVLRHNRSSAMGTEGGGAWLMGTPGAGGHYVQNLEVHDNEAFYGSVNGMGPTVEYSLFAGNTGSGIAYDADLILSSCTFVGNGSPGAAPAAIDGNISMDPQFCGKGGRPDGLEEDSPCAEENNDCGLLLGAYSVDCPDAGYTRTSWSAVKAIY